MSERTPIDRGIIFSPAMVRALLADQKTMTRRLASSPLAKAEPGDRFYVRESHHRTDDDGPPLVGYDFARDPVHWIDRIEQDPAIGRVHLFSHSLGGWGGRTSRNFPSIHMPRWASRITLIVEAKRFEPVDQISERDALAEGIICENVIIDSHCAGGRHSEITADRYFSPHDPDDTEGYECAVDAFAALWDSLHDREGERFAEAPSIVALTFAATLANIDSPEARHG